MNEHTKPIDYYVNVTLSDDKLQAFIHFSNVDRDFRCRVEQLEEILKNQYIVFGIHHHVLAQIASDPTPFLFAKTVVASGELPRNGEDGRIETMFELDKTAKRPAEQEDGKVDFKEVTALNNVRKGELIARRIPAMEGIHGRAVTGETIFAKAGKEARFKIGKNVVVDPEQTAMYAAIDGMVSKTDRDKINVFPIYEVNGDVDYNIGNVDFIGSIVIRGSVLPGFRIRGSGDIRITGSVEGAELEAGGSIEISAGILGHNKGSIKAGKNIKSSFIQDAHIEAGENVTVSQSIMHSTVRAGRKVVCQGVKGLIVGGLVQAGDQVVARTVGNSMSTSTAIEVGVLPELRNEMIQLRQQLKAISENLDKTDKALAILDQLAVAGQLTGEKLAMRIKFTNTKKQALDDQAAIKERILEIEKSLEDSDKASVEVTGMIYGGTKIVIGRYTKFVKDPTQRVRFIASEGDIVVQPLI